MHKRFAVVALLLALCFTSLYAEPPASGPDSPLKQVKELLKKEQFEAALAVCNTVLATEPTNAEALSRRSQAHVGLGKLAEALADLDAALKGDTDNRQFLLDRARVHEALTH